jgi:phospholipid transport system substrate-binding protein
MIDRRLFLLSTSLMLLPSFRPALATTEAGATEHIDKLGQQAFSDLGQSGMSLEEREAVFAQTLRKGFDLPLIARFVMGKYWRRATPEQRDDYVDLFGRFVIKTYSQHLGGFAGSAFEIVGAKPIGKKDVLVRTVVQRKSGPPVKAGWRVREIKDQHKIVDVMVERISMAVTQRQEFASILKRDGVEGLLQILRAKTGRMPATS